MAEYPVVSEISRRSSLAHLKTLMENGSSSRVELREEPFWGQINLRGNPENPEFLSAVQGVLGFDLPLQPNSTRRVGRRMALWLGPDEWMLVVPDGEEIALIPSLRAALDGQHISLVDVSDNRTVLVLTGPAVWTVLNKGCSLDLAPVSWSKGRCAQTLYGRAQVLIAQTGDEPQFKLFVRTSFADYLMRFLLDAMREFEDMDA